MRLCVRACEGYLIDIGNFSKRFFFNSKIFSIKYTRYIVKIFQAIKSFN